MKPKMLFLDDRTKRIHAAMERYRRDYDVTIVTNRLEFLRELSRVDFDIVSMDQDLNGEDFTREKKESGIGILEYIFSLGWPEKKKKPSFVLHSTNVFASSKMKIQLEAKQFAVFIYPFTCIERYKRKVGILAGAFDILHPGYIELFKDARKNACDYLIVAVHDDPSVANPDKLPVIFTADERMKTLASIEYVDEVLQYKSEGELLLLMRREKPDVIIVGSDHLVGGVTGSSLGIPIYYHKRRHHFSETGIKKAICNRVLKGRKQ